jgi:phenylalanyl-tRNA synthetase alpha chain
MILDEQEKRILIALGKKPRQDARELAVNTKLSQAAVDHASARLFSKSLLRIEEKVKEKVELDIEGEEYLKKGLPERIALQQIAQEEKTISELNESFGPKKTKIALVWLARQGAALIQDGKIKITQKGQQLLSGKMPHEILLEKIAKGEEVKEIEELKKRGRILKVKEIKERTIELAHAGKEILEKGIKIEEEVSQLTPELIVTKKWKDINLREYDIQAPIPPVYGGKRHFVSQAMDYVRKIWLEMGFKEMKGPIIETAFWSFDALFVPQDHPAREMWDTLFIEGEGKIPKALTEKVKKTHEKGVAGSIGWGYEWNEKKAKQLLLRPHTTPISARTLAVLKKSEWPAKFFAVGKCFRNEVITWKHLFEFNQVEGIVVDENANFCHLLGYLKEFYAKLGFEKVRFRPSYFPFTEPSLEIDVFHSGQKKWMELGGAGIFRPEVTEPLLGEPVPVLAWGPGFDRCVMDYYKINDIRELYKNDVQKLREVKQWLL